MRVVAPTLSRPLSAAFVLFLAATLAEAGTIEVNGGADTIVADDYLTLREAIALSNGTLTVGQLSALEQAQVGGPVGAGIADEITFVFWMSIIVTSGLEVTDGNTTIEGDTDGFPFTADVNVDAGGATALVLASPGNTLHNVVFRSTTAGVLLRQALASHTTIEGCRFVGPAIHSDMGTGALVNVGIVDNSMRASDPSDVAIRLEADSGSIRSVLISQNSITDYELGVALVASNGPCNLANIVLSFNVIYGPPGPAFSRGVLVNSDGTALVSDVLLADNRVRDLVTGIEISGPGTDRVTLTKNCVYDNDSVPIVITSGANDGIVPPTITSVGTTFTGTVDSSVPDGCTIELFYDFDQSCEPEAYRGTTTTSGGTWSLTASTPEFGTVTATVTDLSGNTSAVGCMTNCVPTKRARNNLVAPFNPDALTCTVPVSPSIWVAEVTHAAGPATIAILQIRSSSVLGNGARPPAPVIHRKLCGGTIFASIVMVPDAIAPISMAQRNCTVAIPPGLQCLEFCAQAVTSGSGVIALSNAIDGNL